MPVSAIVSIMAVMNAQQLTPPVRSHDVDHVGREVGGRDHPGAHRVLEVVAHVGDAIGPRHHLALGRGGPRPVPGVVATASRVSVHRLRGARTTSAP